MPTQSRRRRILDNTRSFLWIGVSNQAALPFNGSRLPFTVVTPSFPVNRTCPFRQSRLPLILVTPSYFACPSRFSSLLVRRAFLLYSSLALSLVCLSTAPAFLAR